MAAPPNEYSYDFDAVEQASKHWRSREDKRTENKELLEQKRYTEVESKDRLTMRANRLLEKVQDPGRATDNHSRRLRPRAYRKS